MVPMPMLTVAFTGMLFKLWQRTPVCLVIGYQHLAFYWTMALKSMPLEEDMDTLL